MLQNILNYSLFQIGDYLFTVQHLVRVVLVIIFTKILLSIIKKALLRYAQIKQERKEDLFTLHKIISYIVWIISFVIILQILGVKATALLTGSAALLVGAGLGLQQTFNDFISGIILLFEGKTKVGDLLEVEGRLMRLKNIGLRTTEGIDRDGVSIIIPNSKIVTDKVINWTHQADKTARFCIKVGIAYGSDIDLALKLLEISAKENKDVLVNEPIEARFAEFGDSALQVELYFFTKEIFRIGKVVNK